MLATLMLVLAQGTSSSQTPPDSGPSAALIIGTIVVILAVFTVGFLVISKRAKASKGGVEPVPGSREKGEPPFESIERER